MQEFNAYYLSVAFFKREHYLKFHTGNRNNYDSFKNREKYNPILTNKFAIKTRQHSSWHNESQVHHYVCNIK